MKKVLLLGDSIRLSYQPLVKDKLNTIAQIAGPEDNCRFAKYTLWYIGHWISELGKPDVIHWNNGIWDVYHLSEDLGIFTPLEEYILDIKRILHEFRKTGAKIIWATTTPVNSKNRNCKNDEIDIYNEAVKEFMQKENIDINDLNMLVKSNIELYVSEDHLHLSEAGQAICGEAVVSAVMKYL